jgi:hypothetical protein
VANSGFGIDCGMLMQATASPLHWKNTMFLTRRHSQSAGVSCQMVDVACFALALSDSNPTAHATVTPLLTLPTRRPENHSKSS